MSLSSSELDSILPEINKNKGLIIDLRGYPQDRRHRLLSYFTVIDTTKWLCSLKILNPNLSSIEYFCKSYTLNKEKAHHFLQTKNVLLIDEHTISNAELFAQLFKHYKLGTVIGRPSAGVNGNVNRVELIDGFSILFTGMKVQNPDGSKFHAVGVLPDIYIYESQNDVANELDVFITKAIEYLKKH